MTTITRERLQGAARTVHTAQLFGVRWIQVESFAFDTAGSLSNDYNGGLWDYYRLNHGGFYMAPTDPATFKMECDNGYAGLLTADAFGITACLYAYSLCSFSPDAQFSETCATHYHLLRDFAVEHAEAAGIFAAID